MAENNKQKENENQEIREAIFLWQAPEAQKYKKNGWWYVISLIVLAGLLWWSINDQNFLFAVFLVLFYLIILLLDIRPINNIEYALTKDGIKVGNNFHLFSEFNHFYIINKNNQTRNLYLEFNNPIKGRIIAPLADQNSDAIGEYLLNFLDIDTDRADEPLSERIRRWLHL